MGIRFLMLVAGLLWICSGCGTGAVAPAGYIQFMETPGNGYRKEVIAGQWLYKFQYKTPGYIFLQENQGAGSGEQEFRQRSRQLEGWCFFNVYVGHTLDRHASPIRLVSNNLEDYNKYLNYYLIENKNNFKLLADTDTLYPTIYVFENNYNLSPEDVIVVGFRLREKSQQPRRLNLIYHDELLKTGIVRCSFNEEDLKKEPQIKFN